MKVLIINPGATSTKIAVFEEEQELMRKGIDHAAEDLEQFAHIVDQTDYRRTLIEQTLKDAGYKMTDFDAVCGRGGLLRHIPSGTYAINKRVLEDIADPPYGEHASNLGAVLAKQLADSVGIPSFFVDPVSVDEMQDVARISGLKGIERQSFFHALNHKAVARKASGQLGKEYEDANLIVVHLGGGVSVAAHSHGRVIDTNNVKDDGAMGLDRGGALPVTAVVNMCFSGKTKNEIKKTLSLEAGVYSYLGTKDFREVESRAFKENEEEAKLIFRAFAYQLAKDIGAMSAVLQYKVDAIVYTGGIAHSDRLCAEVNSYIESIAPTIRIPGEEEMRSLAEGALRVLHGQPAKEYV